MPIDTAAKRSSALDFEEVWQFGTPLPDGTVGQGDRQHLIWGYSGILAAGESFVTGKLITLGKRQNIVLEARTNIVLGKRQDIVLKKRTL